MVIHLCRLCGIGGRGEKIFQLCGWIVIHDNQAPYNSQNLSASCQPRQKQLESFHLGNYVSFFCASRKYF